MSARGCGYCGASLEGRRARTLYCCDAHRLAAWRGRTAGTTPETPGNGYSALSRRPSRDGRGVRVYVLPEESDAAVLAKVEAARSGKVTR
jgi:hypothetical protein